MSTVEEYFKFYTNAVKEYGIKTCVLYELGSFFEVYQVDTMGNADVIGNILNIAYTRKDKKKPCSMTCPNFVGFGTAYVSKYLRVLLEHEYTVVIVEQLPGANGPSGNKQRGITAVHSPAIYNEDIVLAGSNNKTNLTSLMIEKIDNIYVYSICSVNNITNNIDIFESSTERLNEIDLFKYFSKELNIYPIGPISIDDFECFGPHKVHEYPDLYKEYSKIDFQNEYFKKVYLHVNFSLLTPVDYMGLGSFPLSIINFMYTIDYIARHDLKYTKGLALPSILQNTDNLVLELDTLVQLNILGGKNSVFDIIDYTSTVIGKRCLKKLLSNPLKNVDDINNRTIISKCIKDIGYKNFSSIMKKILDIERLHRRMSLGSLTFIEFEKLHQNYLLIIQMFDLVCTSDILTETLNINARETRISLQEYIKEYTETFNIELVETTTAEDESINYFKHGVETELDILEDSIKKSEEEMNKLCLYYNNILNKGKDCIKIAYTDSDSYYLTCTKTRFALLTKSLGESEAAKLSTRNTSSIVKIFTHELNNLSRELLLNKKEFSKKLKENYLLKLDSYYKKYNTLFKDLVYFIETIDVYKSNVECSVKNNYTSPIIVGTGNKDGNDGEDEESYINAKAMRHAIVEKCSKTTYIPNDITFDKDKPGLLLYAINNSGKTTFLRAVGICIILAQCGFDVPCESFEYYPFNTLISQVNFADNLWEGKGSFLSESIGIDKILQCSGKNTMCIADELCKTTESYSAIGMVGSCILQLMKSNTKFFFTTHFHELVELPELRGTRICHLSISKGVDGSWIFNRLLQEGSGSDLYGLEICKGIIKNQKFIDDAFIIRNRLLKTKTSILSTKKSRYNSKKITDKCQVCKYSPMSKKDIPLEEHHIKFQCSADSNNFIKHQHKNDVNNLITLCRECHQKVHKKEILIDDYIYTTNGRLPQITYPNSTISTK